MQTSKITVPWNEGLHLRPAATLVKTLASFRSSVWLTIEGRRTDARSILGILMLAATMGTMIDVETQGDDELTALAAVEQCFLVDSSASSVSDATTRPS